MNRSIRTTGKETTVTLSHREQDEILRLIGIYMPRPQVRQLLGDLARSKTAIGRIEMHLLIAGLIEACETESS